MVCTSFQISKLLIIVVAGQVHHFTVMRVMGLGARELYSLLLSSLSYSVRELWRLRLNFFVLLVISFMGGIGYSSVLSSLHQFVTNPTLEKLNGTEKVCVLGIIQQIKEEVFNVTGYTATVFREDLED